MKKGLFIVISVLLGAGIIGGGWAIASLGSRNQALKNEMAVLKPQYEGMRQAVERLKEKDSQLAAARSVAGKNDRNLRNNYIRALSESQHLLAENALLKSKFDGLDKARVDAEAAAKAKEEAIASLNKKIDELGARIKTLDADKEELVKELDQRAADVQQKLSRQIDEAGQLKSRLDQASSQNADLLAKSKRADALAGELEQLKSQKKALLDENKRLSREHDRAVAAEKAAVKLAEAMNVTRQSYLSAIKKSELELKNTKKLLAGLKQANTDTEALRLETASAHYNTGVLYMRQSQYKEAAAEFERALTLNSNDPLAHYNLGLIDDAYLAKPKEALRHYSAYVTLMPNANDVQKVQYRITQMRLRQEGNLGEDLSRETY